MKSNKRKGKTMDNYITYLLQSSLCLTVFLLFYLLLLKKETFYLGNRFYLIATACFSVFVPLFKILLPSTGYTEEITYFMAPVFITNKNLPHTSAINWFQLSEVVYFAVTSVLLFIFIFKVIKIFLLMKKNESVQLKGQKIIVLEKGGTPFSFLNTIFLTQEQITDPSVNSIIEHEKKHICQFHSMDMILFEIIKIMQWFNPFAWIFKKEIEAQHEFSADSGLMSDGININEYKNVLVAYSFGTGGSTVTNNFNSLLKRRLEMISKQKSHAFGKVKLFFTLPLMAFLLMFISVVNGSMLFASGNLQQDKQEKKSKKSSVSTTLQKDDKEKTYTYVDQMPVFPGGDEGLFSFISKNIVYPEVAKNAGITGKIYVQFVVDKDGSVTNVKVQKGIGGGCDEEAVRVVKLMPKWIPGKNKGELVKTRIAIPIVFALK
jgi:TonB family protein